MLANILVATHCSNSAFIQMLKLKLTSNPIGDAGACALSGCIDKIDDLSLECCDISEKEIANLAENIYNRKNVVSLFF